MSVSGIPGAKTRAAPVLPGHKHPLFRAAALNSYKFDVAAGNNAAPTVATIGTWTAADAGVYLAILETGNNTTFGIFRLDNGGTVTFVQDSGAIFAGTATNAKVAIYNDSGVLKINNQLGAGSTAAAASITITRLTTAPAA